MLAQANHRSDPRGLYQIATREVLSQLEKVSEFERNRDLYLNNLIRLLEMYRYDAFVGHYDPHGILQSSPLEPDPFEPSDEGFDAVRNALIAAHRDVFTQMQKNDVVDYLRSLLEDVRDNGGKELEAHKRDELKRFFEIFIRGLRY